MGILKTDKARLRDAEKVNATLRREVGTLKVRVHSLERELEKLREFREAWPAMQRLTESIKRMGRS